MRGRAREKRWAGISATLVFAGILATGSGCGSGGGSSTPEIDTGGNGRLENVSVGPSPGSTYISTATVFQASWNAAFPPPAQYNVALKRYHENSGSPSTDDQKITIQRQGSTFIWNIQRKDNFDLDQRGVYYLELTSPSSSRVARAAYIVAAGRTAATSRFINTGGNGSLNGIQISPAPGSVYIPRGQTFQISWAPGSQPPAQLGIEIMRYNEDSGTGSAQNQDIKDQGGFVYNVARRDQFPLDQGGAYYLEITAPGEQTLRFAYIIDTE
jgi:hypothetical protein